MKNLAVGHWPVLGVGHISGGSALFPQDPVPTILASLPAGAPTDYARFGRPFCLGGPLWVGLFVRSPKIGVAGSKSFIFDAFRKDAQSLEIAARRLEWVSADLVVW